MKEAVQLVLTIGVITTRTGEGVMATKKNWIKDATKNEGALRKQLGAKKGKPIPKKKLRAAAKKGGKEGQRARLAVTLGKLRKKKA